MNRHCDYSDAAPPPSSEDFNTLRMRLAELEARFIGPNGGNGVISPPPTFATPSSTLSGPETLGQPGPAYNPPQEYIWQGVQNRFPAIAFLDSDSFRDGGCVE